MKKKVNNHTLVEIFKDLQTCRQFEGNGKYRYGLRRNIDRIIPIVKEDQRLRFPLPTENREAFEKEKLEIQKQHFEINTDTGDFIIKDNKFVIIEGKEEEMKKAIEDLYEKYPDCKAAADAAIDKHMEWLNKEVEFDFFEISVENIPEMPDELFHLFDKFLINPDKVHEC